MREFAVINAFVECQKCLRGYQSLTVDRWPDKENRQSPEIDAIAGPLAIEHTSIDSITNQRRDDDWFSRFAGDSVINEYVDCGFTITLDYEATRDAIKNAIRKGKGVSLGRLRSDLERWISGNAPSLSDGSHEIELPTSAPVDPPIMMSIWKGHQPRIRGFRRAAAPDNTLSRRVKSTMDMKAKKLRKYQGRTTTILLVENSDIAFMNAHEMLDAFQEAYPNGPPHGVDEIWFADTSIPPRVDFWELTAGYCQVEVSSSKRATR